MNQLLKMVGHSIEAVELCYHAETVLSFLYICRLEMKFKTIFLMLNVGNDMVV